jgi:hypothetical protein
MTTNNGKGEEAKKFEEQRKKAVRNVTKLTIGASLIGWGCIFAYAWQCPDETGKVSIIGVSTLLAGAFLITGLLLGFLFGYSRKEPAREASEAGKPPKKSKTKPSTNLEQISDWLTKIIVGAGLVQLVSLPGALKDYAGFIKDKLGTFTTKVVQGKVVQGEQAVPIILDYSEVFAIGMLLYYLTCGFLSGYLLTKLYFLGLLEKEEVNEGG